MTYIKYKHLPKIFDQAAAKNKLLCSTIGDYLSSCGNDFNEIIAQIEKMKNSSIFNTQNDKIEEFHTEIYNKFLDMASQKLTNADHFKFAVKELKRFTEKKFLNTFKEYDDKLAEITRKVNVNLSLFDKIKENNNKAYDLYQDAANSLNKAIKVNLDSVNSLRKEFEKARKNAIKVHEECEDEADRISLGMEVLLTEFEDIEIWRANKMREVLIELGSALNNMANQFIIHGDSINQALQSINIDKDSHEISNLNNIKPALGDEGFQLLTVHPLVSKFLPKKSLFSDDVKAGCKLYVVLNDSNEKKHLTVYKDEIVCCVDEEKCIFKDINDIIGTINMENLKPLDE